MEMVGLIGVFAFGMAGLTFASLTLCAALPKAVLESAERHGRFQGLADQETLARGTREGVPPALVLDQQPV